MFLFGYSFFKSILFKFNPETAHNIVEFVLSRSTYIPFVFSTMKRAHFIDDTMLYQDIEGITFKNPVGLAAGLDKNATMIEAMYAMGFGFTEVGTITPKPQEGNAKPRLFRHIDEESLQNAMGFNNHGMHHAIKELKRAMPYGIPVGVNIGKNKTTAQEDAISDYTTLIHALQSYASYLVINISSPNTPGLRDLQNESFIKELFTQAKALTNKPIFLKIAPDMAHQDAIDLSLLAIKHGASGIIATNTTIDHTTVQNPKDIGGISGKALTTKSRELFKALGEALYGKTTLISVGGIDNALEAYERIKMGASLVQLYSAFIFKGPKLIANINHELIALLKADGFEHISQAIGSATKGAKQ